MCILHIYIYIYIYIYIMGTKATSAPIRTNVMPDSCETREGLVRGLHLYPSPYTLHPAPDEDGELRFEGDLYQ